MQSVGKKSETLPGICGDAAIPIRSSKMELSQRKGKSDKLPLLAKVTKCENNVGKRKIKKLTLSSCFKYKIHSGNNCRLIMLALKKRPWFHAVNDSDKEEGDDVVNSLCLIWEMYRNPNKYKTNRYFHVLYNHLENNAVLTTKKGLYESIRAYCQEHTDVDILDIIPRTFYLCAGAGGGGGASAGEGPISACSSADDAAVTENSSATSTCGSMKKSIAQDDMQLWLEFNRTFTRGQQAMVPTTPPLTATASAPATEAIVVAPAEAESTQPADTTKRTTGIEVSVEDKSEQGEPERGVKVELQSNNTEAGGNVVEDATDVLDNNSSSSTAVSPRLETEQVEKTQKLEEVSAISVVELTPTTETVSDPVPPLSSTLQLSTDDASLDGTGTLPSAASTDAIVAMPPPAAVVAGPVEGAVPAQLVGAAPKDAGAAGETDAAPATRQLSLRKRRLQAASTAAAATDNEACVWIMKPASLTNRGFGIKVVRGVEPVLEMVNCSVPSTPEEEKDPPTPSNGSGSSNNSFNSSFATGTAGGNSSGSSKRSPSVSSNASNTSSNGSSGGGSTRMKPTQGSLERGAAKRAKQTGWIVQEYMERPLLIHGRKFDIRCYVVVTHTILGGSKLKAYFYQDAYVRTSCKKYNLSRLDDRETHLTNDAVQKNSKNYGKYEQGNKLSLSEWQQTIIEDYPGASPTIVMDSIFPKIKQLTAVSLAACKNHLCASTFPRSFELFGYDYMVDEDFKPTLIEVNSNPCLETSAPLLADMIPRLIDNVISICVDPVYQPQPLSVSYPASSTGSNSSSNSSTNSNSVGRSDEQHSSRAGTPTYTPMTEEALKAIAAEENRFEELVLPA